MSRCKQVAGELAGLHEGPAHHDARGAIGLVLRLHRLEGERHEARGSARRRP